MVLVGSTLLFLLSVGKKLAFLDFRCACRHTLSKPRGSTRRGREVLPLHVVRG